MNKVINPKYNCSKCHKSNISYKLYGMPAVNALRELESFGVNVEIMGCVPPLANTKTYLFQCKDCKHEWFEYEEKENFFEFLYETYPGLRPPKILYESGFINLEQINGISYFIATCGTELRATSAFAVGSIAMDGVPTPSLTMNTNTTSSSSQSFTIDGTNITLGALEGLLQSN